MKLNRKNRAKIVRILKNTFNADGSFKYTNMAGEPYKKLKSADITHVLVARHKITQEQVDNYIDLGDI